MTAHIRARPELDVIAARCERLPMETAVVAAVQATPVFCDRDATIEKVAELTKEAAGQDARLVAFSEGFVPTYPDWVWRTVPWSEGNRAWYARWFDQAVDIPGPACDALGAIVARARVLPRDTGERTRRRNRLQHALLFRPRRHLVGEAPQARRNRRRAPRVGIRRRLDAGGDRHAVRSRRRIDLLGELHAARACRDV